MTGMNSGDAEPLVVKVPADVDRPDKILYGLTARQVAILAATGLLASWVYLATTAWLPLPVVVAAVLPIAATGVVLTVTRRYGMSLDALLLTALTHLRTPKRRVHAPEGVQPPPGWCRVRGRLPAPLRLPVRAIRDDGVMELADGGTAVIVRAGTVSFALRTAGEQAGLVAAFGRWLNSLDSPVQILIQARPVDLSGLSGRIHRSAPGLPDPALERAARDHAVFLDALNNDYDLLTRQVLIVVRDQACPQSTGFPWSRDRRRTAMREAGAGVVVRRGEETVRCLTALGITAHVLDAGAAAAVLADSLSPGEDRLPGLAHPGEAITSNPGIPQEVTR